MCVTVVSNNCDRILDTNKNVFPRFYLNESIKLIFYNSSSISNYLTGIVATVILLIIIIKILSSSAMAKTWHVTDSYDQ